MYVTVFVGFLFCLFLGVIYFILYFCIIMSVFFSSIDCLTKPNFPTTYQV